MDGVRLVVPTVLLSRQRRGGASYGLYAARADCKLSSTAESQASHDSSFDSERKSTPLPLGLLLAAATRDGHKLACRVPAPSDKSDATLLVPGLSADETADMLLPSNPAVYPHGLDLTVGELRFVSHPLVIERAWGDGEDDCDGGSGGGGSGGSGNGGSDSGGGGGGGGGGGICEDSGGSSDGGGAVHARDEQDVRALNLAIVLDASWATALPAEGYASLLRECRAAAHELCRALVAEERHGAKLVSTQMFGHQNANAPMARTASVSAMSALSSGSTLPTLAGLPGHSGGLSHFGAGMCRRDVGTCPQPSPTLLPSTPRSSSYVDENGGSTGAPHALGAAVTPASSSVAYEPAEAALGLEMVMREALRALRRRQPMSIAVGARSVAHVNACVSHKSLFPHAVATALAVSEGAMPPAPPLRPYLGLLATCDTIDSDGAGMGKPNARRGAGAGKRAGFGANTRAGARAVPDDASPMLLRLLRAATPLRSFHELSVETGIAMPMIFKLAMHLAKWHRMRVVPPLTEESVFCAHPDAPLGPSAAAATDFDAAFSKVPIAYAQAMRLFSAPQRFGDLLRAQQLPARKLVQVTVYLWQRRLLQQLQTCALCTSPPPRPRSDASEQALERWRLFKQVQPMLFGEHSLEEIAWQEGVDRAALNEMLYAYADSIICTVTPVE